MITGIEKITLLPLVTRVEIEKEESSAILVDRQSKTILWQDESTGSFGTSLLQLGLVGMLLMNEDVAAVSNALTNLFQTFPAKNGAH